MSFLHGMKMEMFSTPQVSVFLGMKNPESFRQYVGLDVARIFGVYWYID